MKGKILKTLLLSVMVTALLTGCLDFWHPPEEEKEEKTVVSSVTIIPDSASVLKGRNLQFGAEVIGSNSPAQTVTWSVLGGGGDTSISANGLLTVADDETATSLTVKATSTADNSKSCNATVTISTTAIAVTDVSLDKTTLSLTVGSSETLTATVMPVDAANKVVLWTSSNTAVASVSSTGDVIGMSVGSATITVTTTDGNKTATCSVTVTGGSSSTVAVTGVSLNKTSLSLTVGGSETLSATVSPSNATNKNVSWSSSNTAVATVSVGTVNAVSAGSASITVTTYDGSKTATCSVTVKSGNSTVAVTGVSLNKSSTTITVGNTETLTATVAPSNATNKNVTWSSGNTSVVTVNQNGQVTAVSAGSAVITVTTQDGNKTATCTVTVTGGTVPVTGVSLNKSSTTIMVGNTETLTATVAPSNATNKNVSWSTSAPAVATVSGGTVSAVSTGNATITVTTQDGSKTTTCTVTVTAAPVPVIGVTLNKKTLTLKEGGTETLIATVSPSNATNKNVTWNSSAPDIASVSDTGMVTGKTPPITITPNKTSLSIPVGGTETITVTVSYFGKSDITVTTADGGKTDDCTVFVSDTYVTSTKNISWSSSNSAVATVSSSGLVTGVSAGSATITITAVDSGKTITFPIIVSPPYVPPTGVFLDKTSLSLYVGGTQKLTATVEPSNATNKEVTWKSSDVSIATVSSTGQVTGVSAGSATITSTTVDGGHTATCSVTVTVPKIDIALASSLSLNKSNSYKGSVSNSLNISELQSIGYTTLRITLTCSITRRTWLAASSGSLVGEILNSEGTGIGDLACNPTHYNEPETFIIDIWRTLDSKLSSLTVKLTVPNGGNSGEDYKVDTLKITIEAL
jgi:uncharacterized protein YjdB